MNAERIFEISREISREKLKFCIFPGNFPENSENNQFFRELSRGNGEIKVILLINILIKH